MEIDDYIVHSIDALQSLHLSGVTNFTISVGFSDLRLWCTSFAFELSTDQDDGHVHAAFQQIQEGILRRQSWLRRVLRHWGVWVGWTILTIVLTVASLFIDNQALAIIQWLFLFGFVVFTALSSFALFRTRTVVIPEYSKNVPKPWYASDALKVAIVSFVLGAVLAFVIAKT